MDFGQPDIALIQEVKLVNLNMYMLNYSHYYVPLSGVNGSATFCGGTLIYIKRNIPHSHFQIPDFPSRLYDCEKKKLSSLFTFFLRGFHLQQTS